MTIQEEKTPDKMPKAKLSGANSVHAAKKPTVWTYRMLERLEVNPEGKWLSLIDKVYRKENLQEAFKLVKRNGGTAGVDHVSTRRFEIRLEKELNQISTEMAKDVYRPQAVRRVYIPKSDGGKRPLGIPTVKDRVVQGALKQILEPIYEKQFKSCSYGYRPSRGSKDALRAVKRALDEGNLVVIDADIKGFFENIDHEIIEKLVRKTVIDGRIIKLIKLFLQQEVEGDKGIQVPEKGTPQGGVISPLLANVYLHELDKAMDNYKFIRYADDNVVLCRTKQEAEMALTVIKEVLSLLKLELHPDKTRIVDMQVEGAQFEFLGYRFKRHKDKLRKYPKDKSINKLQNRIKMLTPRRSGKSLKCIIAKINESTKGWFEYFKHSSQYAFTRIDEYIRRRLRAVLAKFNKKRSGRSALGLGEANFLWPIKFFTQHGLFNLSATHDVARSQAARR